MRQKRTTALEKLEAASLQALARTVGDFIRYWGFRRIHGQLWTQIYLSKTPLSGADLMRATKVSKALVSTALSELVAYELIGFEEIDGRTKCYTACPDVFAVIQKILESREKLLIERAQKDLERLKGALQKGEKSGSAIEKDRLESLGDMITAADFAIDFVISSASLEGLSVWSENETAGA